MFVRFRRRNDRLLVSLVESRRVAGKPRQQHICDLGAIDEPPSVAARLAYWRELHQRLGRLGNRIPADKLGSILGAVQARIPMVAVEEQAVERKARLERDLLRWRGHLEASEKFVEAHKGLKAAAEQKIEAWSGQAGLARANIAAVEAAIADPSKPAPRELTPKEARRIAHDTGWTKQDVYRARKLAELSDEELEARLERRRKKSHA